MVAGSSIYDPQFLKCSYGFREGIGCHNAIKDLRDHLFRHEVATIIDIDLSNFFGSINHKVAVEILRERIKDERLIRYIGRMFKAGVLANALQIVASPAASSSVEMGLVLQQAAQKIGLTIDLKQVPADGYWSNYWMKVPVGFGNINPRPTADILFSLFFNS